MDVIFWTFSSFGGLSGKWPNLVVWGQIRSKIGPGLGRDLGSSGGPKSGLLSSNLRSGWDLDPRVQVWESGGPGLGIWWSGTGSGGSGNLVVWVRIWWFGTGSGGFSGIWWFGSIWVQNVENEAFEKLKIIFGKIYPLEMLFRRCVFWCFAHILNSIIKKKKAYHV